MTKNSFVAEVTFYFGYWWLKYIMRYSVEPRDQIYVEGFGFLSFPKLLNSKCGQKLESLKHAATNALKTALKRAI